MHLRVLPLLVVLLVCGFVTGARAQDPAGEIAGVVRDGRDDPIPNALVRVTVGPQEGSARTNSRGQYTLSGLVPGTYSLTAQKPGYDPSHRANVPVVSGQSATVNFRLNWGNPDAGSLEVFVQDRRRNPLPEAEVDLIHENRVRSRGTTDERGSFVFPGLPPGRYRVAARRPGYRENDSRFVRVRERRLRTVAVRLRRDRNQSGRLAGHVRTAAGAPVEGASLRLTGGPSSRNTTSGASGDYQFLDLIPSSSYSLEVTAPGFALQRLGNIRIRRDQLTVLNVNLVVSRPQTGSITGTVREIATGQAIPFARVRITTGPDAGEEVQADVDGRYAFEQLAPHRGVAVVAEAAGFSPGGASGLNVRAGRSRVVNLDLRNQLVQPGTLRGVVRESGSGRLLRNVVVELVRGPSAGLAALTDESGAYEIESVIPDPGHALRFTADGFRALVLAPVSVVIGVTSTVNAELAPEQAARGSIAGTVTAFGGGPLAGVEVSLFQGASSPLRAVTGRDGTYRFRDLRADTDYGIRLSLRGFVTEEQTEIAVTDGREVRLDFVLRQATGTGRIRGRVVDLLQRPVPGVLVLVVDGPFLPADEVRTDSRGAFSIPALPRGTYTLEISGSAIRTQRRGGIVVTPGRATTVLFQAVQ